MATVGGLAVGRRYRQSAISNYFVVIIKSKSPGPELTRVPLRMTKITRRTRSNRRQKGEDAGARIPKWQCR